MAAHISGHVEAKAKLNPNYWGICDMGSNGIRFSITDLEPATARILPAIYTDRTGISLYDAQYQDGKKVPIPQDTINQVLIIMRRFRTICTEFGVPPSQIRIIATEATRVALNSAEYRQAIKDATTWDVTMLPKEIEGRTGAYGVASSFPRMRGLMMDLGGGSTQITWCITESGAMKMSDAGSVSMPYGAAALNRRIDEAHAIGPHAIKDFEREISGELKKAVETIQIPKELLDDVHKPEGLNMYLSGGGFRGWGFMLMSQHPIQPYPINIINGFSVPTKAFEDTKLITAVAAEDEDVFRVSERRSSQVKAVGFLINCVMKAIPAIKTVHFAQGGVREGFLFSNMDDETRAQFPMECVTRPFAKPAAHSIAQTLVNSAPTHLQWLRNRDAVRLHLLNAAAQAMYIHSIMNKDVQAAAALRSTTTGVFAHVNGAGHDERALLAILLAERWGGRGKLAPADAEFYDKLVALLTPELAWWALYFGRVAAIIAQRYPAGVTDSVDGIKFSSSWQTREKKHSEDEEHDGKHGKHGKHDLKHKFDKALKHDKHDNKQQGHIGAKEHIHVAADGSTSSTSATSKEVLVMIITTDADTAAADNFQKTVKSLEKLGKKKNWPHGSGGYKIESQVVIEGHASGVQA